MVAKTSAKINSKSGDGLKVIDSKGIGTVKSTPDFTIKDISTTFIKVPDKTNFSNLVSGDKTLNKLSDYKITEILNWSSTGTKKTYPENNKEVFYYPDGRKKDKITTGNPDGIKKDKIAPGNPTNVYDILSGSGGGNVDSSSNSSSNISDNGKTSIFEKSEIIVIGIVLVFIFLINR